MTTKCYRITEEGGQWLSRHRGQPKLFVEPWNYHLLTFIKENTKDFGYYSFPPVFIEEDKGLFLSWALEHNFLEPIDDPTKLLLDLMGKRHD